LENLSGKVVTLEIMTPSDNLDAYQRQAPLRVKARVVRRQVERGNVVYGVKFEGVDVAQSRRIEECFAYFDKSSRYAA